MNIVKLLPPLIGGQEEVDYFVGALDDVLGGRAHEFRPVVRVRQDARQERSAPGAVLTLAARPTPATRIRRC